MEVGLETYLFVTVINLAWSPSLLVLATETATMEDEERQKKLEAGKAKVGFLGFGVSTSL